MKEIESNKQGWGKVAKDHYHAFRKRLSEGKQQFNPYIQKELGNLHGKSVIHLQCNTGADTILLAKEAKEVTGVDLVPDNIYYANKLSEEFGKGNIKFIESDIMQFKEKHDQQYDVVFVSEGALGWLPDLKKWGETVAHLLKENGVCYVYDSHPFFLMFDEIKFCDGATELLYPYFSKQPDVDDSIGGYASQAKKGASAYFWMYTVSDIIDSLSSQGLYIEFFHEFPELFYDLGGMENLGNGLYKAPWNNNQVPMSFSIKAKKCK